MQISRLFEIVYLLLERNTTTAKELAEHFEVSTRTILRDVDTLSAAGIPVYTSQGKGGGISILDNFVLNKTTISEEDQHQIIFALQSLASTEQIDVSNLLGKLQSFFQKTDTNWIEVDFSRWGNGSSDKAHFELLKTAIIQKQAIAFQYPNHQGKIPERTVYPFKLVFKSKSWYLQGFCLLKQDYRTFKINRMRQLSLLEESFAREAFSPPPIESYDYTGAQLINLKLKFSPQAAFRVYDEFDPKDVIRQEDGSFLVALTLSLDDWLLGFLLTFGTTLEVLEPPDLRTILQQQLREMQQIYD